MATCPNKSLPEWKQLVESRGEPTAYYLWYKNNGNISEFTKAGLKTSQKVSIIKDFLNRIGVNIEAVDEIVIDGVKQNATGVALIGQKLVQIVNGKEDVALPEEAMHFAVSIIKQTNPKLYQRLMKEINGYNMLNSVFAEYGNNPLYQKDGQSDVIKLKEEAIAKVLVEKIITGVEGIWRSKSSKDVIKNRLISNIFWKIILDAINALTF